MLPTVRSADGDGDGEEKQRVEEKEEERKRISESKGGRTNDRRSVKETSYDIERNAR